MSTFLGLFASRPNISQALAKITEYLMDPTNGHGKIPLAFGKSASKLEQELMKKVS